MNESFRTLAQRVSDGAGSSQALAVVLCGVLLWLLLGPVFGFSDTWQLTMATLCTVIATLMVFLIHNTQNRDAKAMQLKLDELIRATEAARNQLIHLEAMTDAELDTLEQEFQRVRATRQPLGVIDPQAADTTRSTSSP